MQQAFLPGLSKALTGSAGFWGSELCHPVCFPVLATVAVAHQKELTLVIQQLESLLMVIMPTVY